jgi:hypothetical protein
MAGSDNQHVTRSNPFQCGEKPLTKLFSFSFVIFVFFVFQMYLSDFAVGTPERCLVNPAAQPRVFAGAEDRGGNANAEQQRSGETEKFKCGKTA